MVMVTGGVFDPYQFISVVNEYMIMTDLISFSILSILYQQTRITRSERGLGRTLADLWLNKEGGGGKQ